VSAEFNLDHKRIGISFVARVGFPSIGNGFMGQQHRKIAKRRRRVAYLERKKAKAKETAGTRREAPKARGKKQAAAAE
jgi:hypothetical protein